MTPTLIFDSLRLVNFGSFIDECVFELNRGPGLWYISGQNLAEPALGANGAGKTTLLHALYWVITGRTMRSRRPGARVEARQGRGSTEVELTWRRGADEQPKSILKRTRKPNSLTLNGSPVTDADALMALGVQLEVLQYTCLFGQSNPMFLDIKKEEQAALFNEVLDLDVWLRVAEKAAKTANAADKEVVEYQKTLQEAKGKLTGFREARKNAKELADKFEKDTKTKLDTLFSDKKRDEHRLSHILRELEKLGDAQDISKLEAQRHSLSLKLETLRDLRRKRSYSITNEEATRADNKIRLASASREMCNECGQPLPESTRKKMVEKLVEQIAANKSLIEQYTVKRDALNSEIDEWNNKLKIVEVKLAKSRDNADIKKRIELTQDKAEKLAGIAVIDSNIKYLSRTPNPHESSSKQLLERIKTLKSEIEDINKALSTVEAGSALARLWQTSAKEIRLSIIDEALEETAAMATKHAERLGLQGWRVGLATERQNTTGETTLGFTALLYPPAEDEAVAWETYSGGEGERLQLAMSFGLSDVLLARSGVIPNLEFLDESTRGLSSEGISDLLDCLSERARESGKTIYFIDHHSLGTANFTGTLVVEKTKSGSHLLEVA